jgi:tRNA threonylcarbamoyladenosine biosynthesis protein TsaE
VVSSPSFTLEQVYKAGKLELHHFDFYRLNDPGIMAAELKEVLENPNNIVIIEWAQSVQGVLPDKRIKIEIKTTDENKRAIYIEGQQKRLF